MDIHAFIWILCVSYRTVNSTTLSFELKIPRCTNSIEDLGDSRGPLSIIFLNTRSGYHQIRIREYDKENLLFSLLVIQRRYISSTFRSYECSSLLHFNDAVITEFYYSCLLI